MRISYKTYLRYYMLATENEISIDKLLIAGMKGRIPPLPRISKWAYGRHKLWGGYISLMIFFILGGFIFYPILKCIVALYKKIITDKNKLIDRSDFYYFSFAEIGTEQAINYYNSKISDGKKLNVIKLSSCNDRSDATVISIYEMASYLDIFKSMLLSIFAFFYFFKSKHTIKWCLQIYTAPSWFLVALVMNRIQGKVISSEHYDRWAVLIDSMLGEKGIQYTLIQHGSLRALDSSAYLLFKIPYKLKHLDKIIVFDEVEFQLFINNILDYNLAEIIKVEYSKPMLSLTQVSSNQLTLLVIGHSLCEKGQLKICSLINQQIENCSIYYKEHPKARASSKVRQFKFNFIIDDNFFPKVDVVISYPSTLAYKYEEMGTLVLFHGLHVVQTEEINEIVMKVILNRGEHGKSKL